MPSSIGTIINGSRGGGGGSSPLTFSSSDGTIDISQVGDNVDITLDGGPIAVTSGDGTIDVAQVGNAIDVTLDGGPIAVTSPDGSIDVDQVGNAVELVVVSTPQIFEADGETNDAVTPLLFVLGTLDSDGDSLDINIDVAGTSSDGDDLRHQTTVGFVAVRRGGAITSPTAALFVNNGVQDGGGGGCTVNPFNVSGNDVRLEILGLAATDITWRVRGRVTFTPGP